jgi:zinc protease
MTVPERPLAASPREYHFPRFNCHKLPNGLRVIVAGVDKLPVVTVLAVINAGASLDPRGQEGLAQLTAESLREGTENLDGMEILDGFERLGSSLEAGADWDSTIVSMTILRDQLRKGLSLFGEVLMNASFPEGEIKRLKAERLAERLQILSEPRGLADESFARFLYSAESRYSEPIGGNSISIRALGQQNVVDFFNSFYTPETATLIVVGDITAGEAIERVTEVLGSWAGMPIVRKTTPAIERRSVTGLELITKSDAAQAEIRLGHVGIPRTDPDYFSVVVMNAILGGLFSSRINLNLREEHGYTYGASSYYDWRRDPGPFVVASAVQSEVTAEAIRETLKEVDRMRSEEISADELSLATSYLEGVFPIRYETTSAIASALANLVIFSLPEDFYDTYRDKIREVRPLDVLNAARNHVHPERLQIIVVGEPALIKEPLEALGVGELWVHAPVEM